jgi:hypothetical protein
MMVSEARHRTHNHQARRWLALACLSLGLVGCDPSHQLAIHSMSTQRLVIRVTETTYAEDFGVEVSTFEVGPEAIGNAFPPEIGPLEGGVEVFDMDCNPVATIPARNGSVIQIRADLSVDNRYLDEQDLERAMSDLHPSNRCR